MRREPTLEVQEVPTSELVPYAGNAKEHTEAQVAQIAASIEAFGFSDPVGVWTDADGRTLIVEGHGRVLAAQRLGLETVPVVRLDHLTDEERRAYALAHNQLNMSTGWDEEALASELAEIGGIDMSSLGFDADGLSEGEVLESIEHVSEDEPMEPGDAPTRVSPGEMWRMGDHLLLCADATDADAVRSLLGGGSRRPASNRPAL